MDEVVVNYLQNAFAFIYVINSTLAGGVQKDRVSVQFSLRLVNQATHVNLSCLGAMQCLILQRKSTYFVPFFSARRPIFSNVRWKLPFQVNQGYCQPT